MKNQKNSRKDLLFLLLTLIISLVLLTIFPNHRQASVNALLDYSGQMFPILPAVLILMGLFSAWISREFVIKHLGTESGVKGAALALFFGALPTGPLYMAFPLAAILRTKEASTANLVIFLSAWACIKIPQEMMEWQFLGLRFMVARLLLTILFVVLMGWIVEKILASKQEIKYID